MKAFTQCIPRLRILFKLLSLSRNGQFSVPEVDLNFVVWVTWKVKRCCHNILFHIFMDIQSIIIECQNKVDTVNISLPWTKISDDCFAVLFREQSIIQDAIHFRVKGFVEGEGSHLFYFVYEWRERKTQEVVFLWRLLNEMLRRCEKQSFDCHIPEDVASTSIKKYCDSDGPITRNEEEYDTDLNFIFPFFLWTS